MNSHHSLSMLSIYKLKSLLNFEIKEEKKEALSNCNIYFEI